MVVDKSCSVLSYVCIVLSAFLLQTPVFLLVVTQPAKLSDITFKDDHLVAVGQSAEVPIHDTNAVDKSNDGEVRDGLRNYSALGPSESNHNVVQGAVEEPVAEGDISRPASQASIHSNEVSSKLTNGKVTWVHPSTLDHPYDSCNKEIAMVASGGGGHYETSPHWQPAEETYDLSPDCRAVGKHPAGEVGKFPTVSDGAAGGGVLGLLQECHSNPPKPSCSAQSVGIPQENHIYSEVDKSHKKSASSSRFPQTGLTHSTDATHVCREIDGSRKVDRKSIERDAFNDDFPTQDVATGNIYAQVDYSKKKMSKKGKKK